ncbi:hypothetical protein ACLB1R_12700 [Escherichia coli]
MKKATTDAPASFLSFAQSHLNGGLCGGAAIRAGSFFPGYANPAQFTTKRLASQVVMIHKEKGSSYGHQNRS